MCNYSENVIIFELLNNFHTQNLHIMETVFFSVVGLLIVSAFLLSRGLSSANDINKY
jgi:hypothetical protein